MTAFVASTSSSPTLTVRSPVIVPVPRSSVMSRSSSHGSCEESSRSWITSSRRSSTACTASLPVMASAAPGIRCASASASYGRSSAFDGMHAQNEHSPPTSRSSTMATFKPLSPSRPAATSPAGPAPITTTSKLRMNAPDRLYNGGRRT
jgi:hypothetical protein